MDVVKGRLIKSAPADSRPKKWTPLAAIPTPPLVRSVTGRVASVALKATMRRLRRRRWACWRRTGGRGRRRHASRGRLSADTDTRRERERESDRIWPEPRCYRRRWTGRPPFPLVTFCAHFRRSPPRMTAPLVLPTLFRCSHKFGPLPRVCLRAATRAATYRPRRDALSAGTVANAISGLRVQRRLRPIISRLRDHLASAATVLSPFSVATLSPAARVSELSARVAASDHLPAYRDGMRQTAHIEPKSIFTSPALRKGSVCGCNR
uniref:Uncharacterized protein n=1 Tax=Plectus sambesii TaxID=2011161 RepID=A0A914WN51_9BILA